jgi:hypothetical protein
MDRQENNGILIALTQSILLQGLNHNSDELTIKKFTWQSQRQEMYVPVPL